MFYWCCWWWMWMMYTIPASCWLLLALPMKPSEHCHCTFKSTGCWAFSNINIIEGATELVRISKLKYTFPIYYYTITKPLIMSIKWLSMIGVLLSHRLIATKQIHMPHAACVNKLPNTQTILAAITYTYQELGSRRMQTCLTAKLHVKLG